MKKIINFINKEKINIIMIFLVIGICFFVPFIYDDWIWGSPIGIKRLVNHFRNYNGRWAGNILVILLTRSNILKTIVMFITIILTVNLMNITVNGNKKLKHLIIFLLLVMPRLMFTQTISWVSGFTNYCVPIPIILYFIYSNKKIFELKEYKLSNRLIIINLLLGFIASLFMEHVTIYNLILSIVILYFDKKINKKISGFNLSYFIGSLLGTILMFSNGAYLSILNSTDTYRNIKKDNIIIAIIKTYFTKLSLYGVTINNVLNIIMCLLLLKLNNKGNNKENHLIKISNIIIVLYFSYSLFSLFGGKILKVVPLRVFEGLLVAMYSCSIIISTFYSVKDKKIKNELLFYIGSIIILLAPLTIVTPLNARCFYVSYIFFSLYNIKLFDYLNIKSDTLFNYVKIIDVLVLSFYFIIFCQVFIVDKERRKLINNGINSKESKIILPSLPYGDYMYHPDPHDDVYMKRFKLFYNIDNGVEIVIKKEKKLGE